MKHATEYIRGLQIKLYMMGTPFWKALLMFEKNSNAIVCHHVCEGIAIYKCQTAYINMNKNPAHFALKFLYGYLWFFPLLVGFFSFIYFTIFS